jgi:hypothetical protein
MDYCSCREYANDALYDEASDMGEAGKLIKGLVHYSEQDEKCLWDNGYVCLCYKGLNGTGESNTLTKEFGEHLVETLKNAGAIVDWNGDPDRAICLYAW